ncbi:UDP-N-acetylmuramyl pentapeptide phosphotransferase/UDP-N-acetylglucosamine-1-phosphate transferase [Tepidimonas ignava]|uniref:UDP-N-acetylmuramyl pentapeptide phosphotransferase/UDP-N-acetylglucosamine-1-phosphate transferase n=1 Tax=Tepidimonas ignava TaxID=114249 RepID=A0A4R3L266_9BURK|nr:glycosyltransferase [Tepidimonas ignava]TCS93721.1 UDP-N-acetylmuramyl pentapeptide phosphotransferase/UDP-N-acetylglucosamine-1-phosphate transferase [Tepidimonas ignava]TSE18390.1 putative undecaprenyl-phosphate N-acetylglucosaminyl 1-phosphate transferase [Tepidimonas ignava]
MQTLWVSFLVSFVVALLLVRFRHLHVQVSGDHAIGVQKFHTGEVPRVGGVALLLGFGGALAWSGWRGLVDVQAAWLTLASLPAWMVGLAEDITKRVGVTARLVGTVAAAGVAIVLLGAQLPRLGVPGLDALLATFPVLGMVLTLVAVAGVANAINIIDGFNGLAAAVSILMFMAFGYVAWSVGDGLILQVCLAMIGALAGFFIWNYPRGLIFMGDGGAYFTGFMLAEVAVLLVVRHPQVSPWFGLLVCAYPITETLFSVYRKRCLRGISPGVPDALHLHMLVYRRLVRWAAGYQVARDVTRRNAATSPYLWGLASMGVVPALLFWRSEALLQLSALGFAVVYVTAYARLVRFRVPRWARRRLS